MALQHFKLLLPALIPSWRFFDWIAPSPRIEYTLHTTPDDAGDGWREFRPRPAHLSVGKMFLRLWWNPRWNESLFLVSCAERLMEGSTDHSSQEIIKRISAELKPGTAPYVQFRLVFLSRQGRQIQKQQCYVSPVYQVER